MTHRNEVENLRQESTGSEDTREDWLGANSTSNSCCENSCVFYGPHTDSAQVTGLRLS